MQAVKKLEKRFNNALGKLDAGAEGKASEKENAAFSKEITRLKEKLDNKNTKIISIREKVTNMSEVEAASKKEISALKTAAEAAQKNTSELDVGIEQANAEKETASKRIEELEGQLKEAESKAQISGESGDQSVSEDMNTAMKAELEALHAQRKADLAEVNAILEKLSPLVEGK